jgi:hypothetical protein
MRIADCHAARKQVVDDALVAFLLEEVVDGTRNLATNVGMS